MERIFFTKAIIQYQYHKTITSGRLPEGITHQAGCLMANGHLCWRRGVVVSGVRRMNEVNARRARLVPGWVTVFGRVYHLGM